MGAKISYYLNSYSQQDIYNYMIDCDNKDESQVDDNIYVNNNKLQTKYGLETMPIVNCFHVKYYKLYIYIDPTVSQAVKDTYIVNANKHNIIIDSYLNVLNNIYKSDMRKKNNQRVDYDYDSGYDMENYCFDAGFDLICPEDIDCGDTNCGLNLYTLDHKINCCMKLYDGKSNSSNEKFVSYYLYSRSSTPSKTYLRLSNSVGIIDSGYRGNIKAMFDYHNNNYDFINYVMKSGVRYVQLCPPNIEYPMKVFIVDSFDDLGKSTLRGSGGFGSTGK